MKRYIHHDVFIGIFLLVFCGVFFVTSLGFPSEAAVFPRFFIIAMAILAVCNTVTGVRETRNIRQREDAGKPVEKDITFQMIRLPMIGFAMITLYILLIPVLGFFVSTTVFLVGFMCFLKVRSLLLILLSTLGVDVFLYVLFVMQLRLSLPAGLLF